MREVCFTVIDIGTSHGNIIVTYIYVNKTLQKYFHGQVCPVLSSKYGPECTYFYPYITKRSGVNLLLKLIKTKKKLPQIKLDDCVCCNTKSSISCHDSSLSVDTSAAWLLFQLESLQMLIELLCNSTLTFCIMKNNN